MATVVHLRNSRTKFNTRCAFCGLALDVVLFMFRSPIGGDPPCICDACVSERAAWLEQERKTPGFLAGVIAIQKASLAERWAEDHPNSASAAPL